MTSPLAAAERTALIEAILPEVAFDGWSRAALRAAAGRAGISAGAAMLLFPKGAADLVAEFSHWADRRMLDRFEAADVGDLRLSERIAFLIELRLDCLTPWREAVRRGLAVLALPPNAALALRLLYDTVDAMWYAAGDAAVDFSFYTKRASLAGLWAATVLYWLEDRSEGAAETRAFVARRLAGLARIGRVRDSLATAAARLPNPLRVLRPLR